MFLETAILSTLFLRSVLSNLWTLTAIRALAVPPPREPRLRSDRTLLIVLPVYDETAALPATVYYLKQLLVQKANVRVLIVGTARERDGTGGNPTLNAAQRAIGTDDRFVTLEDPRSAGRMAHQINYAVTSCPDLDVDVKGAWLYIINVDSRLTHASLEELIYHINHDNEVIHQSAVFFSGFEKLNWICRGFSLWQSRWTISHELKRFAFHNRCSHWLMHIVGHGLCISWSVFVDYKLFPEDTPTEDLHFGFYLAASGKRVTVLRSLAIGDSPTTFMSAMRQKYVWAHGPMYYVAYLKAYRRRFPALWPTTKWRAQAITLQGLLSWADWMVVSWVIAWAAYRAALGSVAATVFIIAYFVEYYQTQRYFARSHLIPETPFWSALAATAAASIFHSLPANIAFIHRLAGVQPRQYKTPHD